MPIIAPSRHRGPAFSCLSIIIMPSTVRGLLDQYADAGWLLDVPMGEALFVDFRQMPAIGTRSLGSCSVAMVVSEHGAILAHIPPLPSFMSSEELVGDPDAGNNNVHAMMRRVREIYRYYQPWFPTAATHVVCAWHHGAVALPDQLAIVQGHFREIGSEPAIHRYVVPGHRDKLGNGTVIAISSTPGTYPAVYVEDSLVSSATGQAAATASTALVQAGFASGTDQAGGSTAAPERMRRKVRFEIVRHRTRRDEYVFRNAQNQRVSTDRADWHVAEIQGRAVWTFRGRKTTYYTYQEIQQ